MNEIRFWLNGKEVHHPYEPTKRLLDVLRDYYSLTGSKEGCGEGECGACSVLIDSLIYPACITPLAHVSNAHVYTIEGIKALPSYAIIEEAFIEEGAVQCGICTPGMVMATLALLKKTPHPTLEQIKDGISGNLCRCTGYNMIVKAVLRASLKGESPW